MFLKFIELGGNSRELVVNVLNREFLMVMFVFLILCILKNKIGVFEILYMYWWLKKWLNSMLLKNFLCIWNFLLVYWNMLCLEEKIISWIWF